MKKCSHCKQLKSNSLFYANARNNDGLAYNCIACCRSIALKHHFCNHISKIYPKIKNKVGEEWRPVLNFSGFHVSNFGRVKTLNYRKSGREYLLKPSINVAGYCTVALYSGGKKTVFRVHRLIMIVFYGEKKELDVDHINGVKTDNVLSNLRYCTHSENVSFYHKKRKGLAQCQ